MTHIVWDNSWNSSYESIDKQHHDLVDIVNSINTNNNNVLTTVEALIDYSAIHFADEEMLLKSIDYPESDYLAHKAEHILLKHTLLDFSFLLSYALNDVKRFKLQTTVFKNFVVLWFRTHFLLADKKFIDWLKAKGGADASS